MAVGIGAIIAGGAIAAASSLGGAAIKAGTDAYQNDQQRRFEADQSAYQREHELRMAYLENQYKLGQLSTSSALDYNRERSLRSTQYQDAVADMKKAGINPAALGQTIGQVSAATPTSANTTGTALAFGANNILAAAVQQTAVQNKSRLRANVKKIAVNTANQINKVL